MAEKTSGWVAFPPSFSQAWTSWRNVEGEIGRERERTKIYIYIWRNQLIYSSYNKGKREREKKKKKQFSARHAWLSCRMLNCSFLVMPAIFLPNKKRGRRRNIKKKNSVKFNASLTHTRITYTPHARVHMHRWAQTWYQWSPKVSGREALSRGGGARRVCGSSAAASQRQSRLDC